jgi:hypothetical protein
MTIMPAFDRYPEEASIIGRILVAFGELELTLATTVGVAGLASNIELGLRALYKVRSTASRLDLADTLLRPAFAKKGLEPEYLLTKAAIKYSQTIRNQYAYCIWGDHINGGLFFTDLEKAADRTELLSFQWKHVDIELLRSQIEYFDFALQSLHYIHGEYMTRAGSLGAPVFPKPQAKDRPLLHNLASQHVPQWLSPSEKRRHLELALADEAAAPLQERPPSVLRLTREEWAAKDAKEARQPGERK